MGLVRSNESPSTKKETKNIFIQMTEMQKSKFKKKTERCRRDKVYLGTQRKHLFEFLLTFYYCIFLDVEISCKEFRRFKFNPSRFN